MAKNAMATIEHTNLPANLAAEMAQEVEDLRARLTAPSGDRIKVDNKVFTLPNGDSSDILSCVIVDFVYMNAYYPGAYDSNNIVPPDCFALSAEPKTMVPSMNSPDRQCDNCASCDHNKFGTAGTRKSCKNMILLAVLPPDATPESPLMTVSVSPTALKSFAAYVSGVARALSRPPYAVVTDITCDPNFKYDTLRFGNPAPLDADVLGIVRSRRTEARERLMTEPDLTAVQAANDKPKGRLQAPKRVIRK